MPAKRATKGKAKSSKAAKAKPAKAKASKPKASKSSSKASKSTSGRPSRPSGGTTEKERRHCVATDPFGDPCQSAPRLPSKYCTIHSYLDR